MCTLGLSLFSCINTLEVVSEDEIEIIRTSRDSTYFKDGSLFTGQIKKIVDDKELLSFSVNRGKIHGQYIEYYLSGSKKKILNFFYNIYKCNHF